MPTPLSINFIPQYHDRYGFVNDIDAIAVELPVARQGLPPGKKRQAALGLRTPKLTGAL